MKVLLLGLLPIVMGMQVGYAAESSHSATTTVTKLVIRDPHPLAGPLPADIRRDFEMGEPYAKHKEAFGYATVLLTDHHDGKPPDCHFEVFIGPAAAMGKDGHLIYGYLAKRWEGGCSEYDDDLLLLQRFRPWVLEKSGIKK
jgi:hypothetical protein